MRSIPLGIPNQFTIFFFDLWSKQLQDEHLWKLDDQLKKERSIRTQLQNRLSKLEAQLLQLESTQLPKPQQPSLKMTSVEAFKNNTSNTTPAHAPSSKWMSFISRSRKTVLTFVILNSEFQTLWNPVTHRLWVNQTNYVVNLSKAVVWRKYKITFCKINFHFNWSQNLVSVLPFRQSSWLLLNSFFQAFRIPKAIKIIDSMLEERLRLFFKFIHAHLCLSKKTSFHGKRTRSTSIDVMSRKDIRTSWKKLVIQIACNPMVSIDFHLSRRLSNIVMWHNPCLNRLVSRLRFNQVCSITQKSRLIFSNQNRKTLWWKLWAFGFHNDDWLTFFRKKDFSAYAYLEGMAISERCCDYFHKNGNSGPAVR